MSPLLGRLLALVFAGASLAADGASNAQQSVALAPDKAPLWLRYPALSPDGGTIAFNFEGNIFAVPSTGGLATLLTTGMHYAFNAVWSPDSGLIAFAADDYGDFDVFLVSAKGGPIRRLTTHSADEIPTGFSPDGKSVLFSAHRMDSRKNAQFPSARTMPELYQVSVEGGREPEQILTTPALSATYDSGGGRLLYEDLKGYENLWRKHAVSPVTHDIWLYDKASGRHTRLTPFEGEDREPVWAPGGESFYFLSEKSGSFNVWRMPLDAPDQATQITFFDKHPVRFLSASTQGFLCFGFDGEIYTLPAAGGQPRKVAIEIANRKPQRGEIIFMNSGATEIALNPDGKEIAFVARGEVFVTSVDHGVTKRITSTAWQERGVTFSPDGRHLVFAGERHGSWNLYLAAIRSKDEPYFYDSTLVDIQPLIENGHDNFQPDYSPDGKEIAYLEDRTTLKVLNLDTKKGRVVLPGNRNYSYRDGDQWFEWSPDGKWFLVSLNDSNRWSDEVALIDSQGKGPLVNLTRSGYEDAVPHWGMSGNAMIWLTDRAGLRGNGLGSDVQRDVYAAFFNRKTFDRFKLSKPDLELLKKKEAEERAKPKENDPKNDQPAAPKAGEKKTPEPVQIDTRNIEDRTVRLTISSNRLADARMTPDGEELVYLARGSDGLELWMTKARDKETRRLSAFKGARGDADLVLDKEGRTAFVLAGGQIQKVDLPRGKETKTDLVKFNAEMQLDRAGERAYIFEHAWRQVREKFYVKDLHGVDWDFYKAAYAKFLPYIANNRDFAEMLSEMLGELNASHTGSSYHGRPTPTDETAALGAFFDPAFKGDGLRIEEIIAGGPLSLAKSKVKPGMIIERIDGVPIIAGADVSPLLNRKADKPTLLSVFDAEAEQRFEETVKPISLGRQEELLYERWVKSRWDLTQRLSGGRLGYVHIRGMNDSSYREAFSDILGKCSGKQSVVVDTRFNGGGNLHDELVILLSGRAYLEFVPRGRVLGAEPTSRWNRKSIVLMSESNYSDAHLFPWTYRNLGVGKLVGMPVAGTGTAVWWETQLDPALNFGIPQVGFRDKHGNYMEKVQLDPDFKVENDPESVAQGRDRQLEKAVEVLLKEK